MSLSRSFKRVAIVAIAALGTASSPRASAQSRADTATAQALFDDSIPATTVKEYVEILGGVHQAALAPNTIPSHYAIAWIKYNVDGDARYRPLLDTLSSGLSAFHTTLP